MQLKDIHPEDFIIQTADGRLNINHDLVTSVGLFNLDRGLRESLLEGYLENARQMGPKSVFTVSIFIMLSRNIHNFPYPVISNFTSGRAYDYNMKVLSHFSGR